MSMAIYCNNLEQGEAGTALAVDWWKGISIAKVSQEF
jgi:hypothetical protein